MVYTSWRPKWTDHSITGPDIKCSFLLPGVDFIKVGHKALHLEHTQIWEKMQYSQHPKSGLSGFIGFNFMTVPDIQYPDKSKSGQKCPDFKWLA
jgi:hypothetical protein